MRIFSFVTSLAMSNSNDMEDFDTKQQIEPIENADVSFDFDRFEDNSVEEVGFAHRRHY